LDKPSGRIPFFRAAREVAANSGTLGEKPSVGSALLVALDDAETEEVGKERCFEVLGDMLLSVVIISLT
jgi:hypothetical protein